MPNPWTTYAQRTLALENKFLPGVKKAISTFRASFINDLKTHGQQQAISNLDFKHFNERLTTIIQTIYKTAGLMGAKMQAEELKAAAKQKSGGFGVNEQWVRIVLQALKLHMINILADMTATMKEDILKVLNKAAKEGWSIDQIVKELNRGDIIEARARVIARTEINKAANAGHSAAAQTMPYEVDKGWSAARDHRTRHSHQAVNGQYVSETDKFKVPIYKGKTLEGYEEMDGPGDPTASAGNVVNCRCRRIFKPKRDANGNLIMRNPNAAVVVPMNSPARVFPIPAVAATLKNNIFIGISE
jgi:uncharacterized protein with gpF-like domain